MLRFFALVVPVAWDTVDASHLVGDWRPPSGREAPVTFERSREDRNLRFLPFSRDNAGNRPRSSATWSDARDRDNMREREERRGPRSISEDPNRDWATVRGPIAIGIFRDRDWATVREQEERPSGATSETERRDWTTVRDQYQRLPPRPQHLRAQHPRSQQRPLVPNRERKPKRRERLRLKPPSRVICPANPVWFPFPSSRPRPLLLPSGLVRIVLQFPSNFQYPPENLHTSSYEAFVHLELRHESQPIREFLLAVVFPVLQQTDWAEKYAGEDFVVTQVFLMDDEAEVAEADSDKNNGLTGSPPSCCSESSSGAGERGVALLIPDSRRGDHHRQNHRHQHPFPQTQTVGGQHTTIEEDNGTISGVHMCSKCWYRARFAERFRHETRKWKEHQWRSQLKYEPWLDADVTYDQMREMYARGEGPRRGQSQRTEHAWKEYFLGLKKGAE